MSPNIQTEARLLLLSAATGAGLMAAYDVLRVFRLLVRHSWLWIGIEDFLYWICAGFAVFYLLYRENDGALRLYVIGSVLLTMIIYNQICSSFLLKVLKKAGRCLKINRIRKQKKQDVKKSW